MTAHTNQYRKNKKEWLRDKVVDYVFKEIATTSHGIEYIVTRAEHDLPSRRTIMEWIAENETIAHKYARAKEDQADYMAEEILKIADDGFNDFISTGNKDSEEIKVLNKEHVQRSRLRIDSRKWLMSKLKPKKYGDKLEMSGNAESPLTIQIVKYASDTDTE